MRLNHDHFPTFHSDVNELVTEKTPDPQIPTIAKCSGRFRAKSALDSEDCASRRKRRIVRIDEPPQELLHAARRF